MGCGDGSAGMSWGWGGGEEAIYERLNHLGR